MTSVTCHKTPRQVVRDASGTILNLYIFNACDPHHKRYITKQQHSNDFEGMMSDAVEAVATTDSGKQSFLTIHPVMNEGGTQVTMPRGERPNASWWGGVEDLTIGL